MVMDTIFCRYEGKAFPAEQFSEDPEWGTVHDANPRHTSLGTPIDDEWQIEQAGGA